MKPGRYILIAGAILLMGQLFFQVQPSVASVDEEKIITNEQPSEYEQELLMQQEAGQDDENYPAELGQPGEYEQDEEEAGLLEENVINQDDQAIHEEQQMMQEGEKPLPAPAAE